MNTPLWHASPDENGENWYVWDIYQPLPPKPVFFGTMEDAGLVADALNVRQQSAFIGVNAMLDLEPIKARLAAATPGPWHSCPDGGCKCPLIMCDDYPVAEVTKGAWGDRYPAVRLVGDTSLNMKAEAYMEQITYGEVPEAEALANRAFIREAPADIAALIDEIERLRAEVSQSQG